MPPEGFSSITVPEKLHDALRKIAKAEGLNMVELLEKLIKEAKN